MYFLNYFEESKKKRTLTQNLAVMSDQQRSHSLHVREPVRVSYGPLGPIQCERVKNPLPACHRNANVYSQIPDPVKN